MIKSAFLLLPMYVTLMWALVFLFQKKPRIIANKSLGLFMLAASILYVTHTFFFFQSYHIYSFLESVYFLVLLSICPFFFAYILLLTSNKIKCAHYFTHFIPAIFFSLASLLFTFYLSPEQRVDYVKDVLIERNLKDLNLATLPGFKGLILLIVRIIFIGQIVIYLLAGIRITNKHNKRLTEFYSNTEGRSVQWLRHISIVMLIVATLGIFFAVVGRSYFAKNEISLLFPSLVFSTVYFLIGFYANQQILISDELAEVVNHTHSEHEALGDSHQELLKGKLLTLFENEKIYRLSDLRITTISETLQTNRTYISRLINEEFGVNFNEFVNKYRVEEAETLLRSKEHAFYTLDYIAEKSGFGSTNSFTRAFKEYKGVTPGTFRNNLKEV